jgi:hypothetical protein
VAGGVFLVLRARRRRTQAGAMDGPAASEGP